MEFTFKRPMNKNNSSLLSHSKIGLSLFLMKVVKVLFFIFINKDIWINDFEINKITFFYFFCIIKILNFLIFYKSKKLLLELLSFLITENKKYIWFIIVHIWI